MKEAMTNRPVIVVKKKRHVVLPTPNEESCAITQPKPATEKLSRKPMKTIMAILAESFPEAFGKEIKPLKVGIHKDLLHSSIREKLSYIECREGIHYRISGIKYLERCTDGATRVDLEGNACGLVTKEQAKHAVNQLNFIIKKLKSNHSV